MIVHDIRLSNTMLRSYALFVYADAYCVKICLESKRIAISKLNLLKMCVIKLLVLETHFSSSEVSFAGMYFRNYAVEFAKQMFVTFYQIPFHSKNREAK